MKRFSIILLSGLLLLASCGGNGDENPPFYDWEFDESILDPDMFADINLDNVDNISGVIGDEIDLNEIEPPVKDGYNFEGWSTIPPEVLAAYPSYKGHYYYVFNENLTWEEAKKYCDEKDGHLVTITDQGEYDFILNFIDSNISYWIGASNSDSSSWSWITNEVFDYHDFNSNAMSKYKYAYMLNEEWRGTNVGTNSFICEWEPDKVTEDNKYFVEGDDTLYPIFSVIPFNITYNLDDGFATNPTIYTVTTPTFTLNNPEKDDYNFAGWIGSNLTEPTYEVVINQGTYGDLEFTALWKKKEQYKVVYHDDDSYKTYDYKDLTFTALSNQFGNKEHYSFVGWSYTNGGSVDVYPGDVISNTSYSNIDLYAVWDKDIHSLKYYDLEGEYIELNVPYNDSIVVNNPYVFEGYNLQGWSTIPGGNIVYRNGDNLTVTKNINLYPVVTEKIYNITYDLSGGYFQNESQVKYSYSISSDNFVLPSPVREGYNFIGWSGTNISGTSQSVIVDTSYLGDRHYVANWSAKKVQIIYNANGGTGSMQYSTGYCDGEVQLRDNTFVNDGKQFLGWSLSPDTEAVSIFSGAIEFNGHYYYKFSSRKQWETAKLHCEEQGGHLVTITSNEELDFINNNFSGSYFIGAYYENNKIQWLNNEGQVSVNLNNISIVNTDTYIYMLSNNGVWTNVSESQYNLGFLCEWDYSLIEDGSTLHLGTDTTRITLYAIWG